MLSTDVTVAIANEDYDDGYAIGIATDTPNALGLGSTNERAGPYSRVIVSTNHNRY